LGVFSSRRRAIDVLLAALCSFILGKLVVAVPTSRYRRRFLPST
jgi:hypothetical protein